MNSEQINVHLAHTGQGSAQLVIRHGEALPEIKPLPLKIEGQIGAPAEYLAKRGRFLNIQNTHVLVNESAATIDLVLNDNDELRSGLCAPATASPAGRGNG